MTHIRHNTPCIFFLILLLVACSAPPAVIQLTRTTSPPEFTPPVLPPTFTPPTPLALVDGKVDVGGYSFYLHCEGIGSPTVVLDPGLQRDSSAWATIIPRILPVYAITIVPDWGKVTLHNSLTNAHIEGPYELVGWSIAGYNMRVLASDYPEEVVGMVMVGVSFRPDLAARILVVLHPESPDESTELKNARKSLTTVWADPTQNIEGMDLVASEAQVRATGSLGAMPLIVLTAGVSDSDGLDAKLFQVTNQVRLDMQNELTDLSSNSTHIVVPNASHCIQCDAPDVVADAILNILDATGTTSSLSKLELVWSLTGEPNLLDAPQGVTVDTQGNLYVIDTGNRRIQKFDTSGKFLELWGEIGTGPEPFRFTELKFGVEVGLAAAPLAVDGQSNFYIADPLNHRIRKFDANGQFLTQWGAKGDGDGQFRSPFGIAVDARGNIFVSDFTHNDIQKFNSQGKFVLKWGGKGSEGGKFNHPGSIAVDTQGNVYVVDYGNSRIQKFDGEGKLLLAWGNLGSGSGQFSQPVAVTVDKAGSVYILDSGNWRIQKFDTNGSFLASWVRFGKERFHAPLGMTVDDDGYIYVSDIHDNRVVKLKQP